MKTVDKIVFKAIKRISPSQFSSMKNCSYKSLLAEAFDKKPLLPVSPNAYFGTVLHKILELIAKGLVRNENDFNEMFDTEVKLQEKDLKQQGYAFFVPLQKNVKDFGMKKVLLKKHLRYSSERPPGEKMFFSEKWFESTDKLIAGKIDLVVEQGNETEIIDFKTGAITQDILDDSGEIFLEIKEEYRDQLKLYAHLYFEATGRFPTRLSLIDLAKQKFEVVFSKTECNSLFENAKNLLHEVNKSIDTGLFSANPSVANCKYCLYRPACSFFLKYSQTSCSFNDVTGVVKNIIKYQNGNLTAFIESAKQQVSITGFPPEKLEDLIETKAKQISVFNLKKDGVGSVYAATKTTVIYE